MRIRHKGAFPIAIAAIGCVCVAVTLTAIVEGAEHAHAAPIHVPAGRDDAAAAAAFESIVPVLHHPRCMNCHSSGDYPRQGDDNHPHIMRVRRGPDGHGVNAVLCSTCHQDHNLAGLHMPPGAPGWHLPTPAMPMIWEGLSDHDLCELLKDPKRNGNRTIEQIVKHMQTPLVLWGWAPGEGRSPIPISQHLFLTNVERWASMGAACPAR
jgi:hypothetical protein